MRIAPSVHIQSTSCIPQTCLPARPQPFPLQLAGVLWLHGTAYVRRTSKEVEQQLQGLGRRQQYVVDVKEERWTPRKPAMKATGTIISDVQDSTCLTAMHLEYFTAPPGTPKSKQLVHKVTLGWI